ncbi:MAG TPA: copper chaperone CopZ [Desulfitobacteriaceae bacterium]|nr:copper chaperone CopZ [Desulfitobacteriaceae bacterium]
MGRENTTLSVRGMSCSHCENSIKKAVGALNGVYEVRVDLAGKKVTVDYDPAKVNIAAIREAIEDQGYDVE